MKTLIAFLCATLVASYLFAQDITGKWSGMLKLPGAELTIVLNVEKNENGYSATMDSPDQGAFGIPVKTISFENNQLKWKVKSAMIEYNGTFVADHFEGTFKQGKEFPLNLTRSTVERKLTVRSQEPVKPYPYRSEEVTFLNEKAGIKLAGTLTLPQKEGIYPAVILISGSGPQNRDEELMGHKPFLVLSDYLTRNGIAVLRYDDRGTYASEGDYGKATSADFADDAESAVSFLKTRKEIDASKIGLMGHSEGGIIAPMVAARNNDVAFIVMLAGPGMSGRDLLPLQAELIARASGVPEDQVAVTTTINSSLFNIINTEDSQEVLTEKIESYLNDVLKEGKLPKEMSSKEMISGQISQLVSPWMRYFLNYDPVPTLEKVQCPVLAVNGEKDLQVPPKENLRAIEKALKKGGNNQVTLIEFPAMNHLFQECQTGSPEEYGKIEQTFSPKALQKITEWIVTATK